MGTDKPPRHVAVALVFDIEAHKLLMVSSRAHPGMWIREPPTFDQGNSSQYSRSDFYFTSMITYSHFVTQYPKAESRKARHQVKRQSGSRSRRVRQ
jgi:hypothetical protein